MKSEMTFRALSLFISTSLLLSAQEEWKPDLPDQENADGYQFSPKKTPKKPTGDNSQVLIPSRARHPNAR